MPNISNIFTVAKKDLKGFFSSPIGWVFLAVFSFVLGFMFISILNYYSLQSMQFDQMKMGKGPSLVDHLIKPIFGNMNVVLLFSIPFVTMRLFAEEKKNSTLELLMTSPLNLSEIVLGKFLSAVGFAAALLLSTLPFALALYLGAKPDWGVIIMSYLGTLLMVSVYISVGLMCSSFTENQIVAVMLTFGFVLFFWIIKWASYNASPVVSEILSYLSIVDHFEDFSKGVFNSKDLVFYFSSIFVWLYITYKSLESYTWRS